MSDQIRYLSSNAISSKDSMVAKPVTDSNQTIVGDKKLSSYLMKKQQTLQSNLAKLTKFLGDNQSVNFDDFQQVAGIKSDYFTNSKTVIQNLDTGMAAGTKTNNNFVTANLEAQGINTNLDNISNLTNRLTDNRASTTINELGSQINNTTQLAFGIANQGLLRGNMPLLAAMLLVTIDMSNIMGIYVNYAQQQMQQMNTMQALVQNMVSAVLQFSTEMQNVYNKLVSTANSYNQAVQNYNSDVSNNGGNATDQVSTITPPSDMYITNDTNAVTGIYISQINSVNYNNNQNQLSFNTFGIGIGSNSGQWSDVGLASAMGGNCMTQSGIAYVDLPDSYDLNQAGTLDNALGDFAQNPNANSSAMQTYDLANNSPNQYVTGNGQTGNNMCFVVTQQGSGVNIPGSLSFPPALFQMIPSSYLSSMGIAASMNNTNNTPTETATTYNTSGQSVGYLNMGMLSAICQNVLSLAGTYLPTSGYQSQLSSALGAPSNMPPSDSTSTAANAPQISIKSLPNFIQSISQIPANLSPTISSFQQQVQGIVQAVTQMFQLLNEMIPNLTMK